MAQQGKVAELSVSRETTEALEQFSALVERWNSAINLVGKATVPDLWNRHIVDSAQLFARCPPEAKLWLDLGSGGGFPGIVIAVLARELQPRLKVALVESDIRKATFLRESCRALRLTAVIHNIRIESLPPQHADVVSARALAPLNVLLLYAERHLAKSGLALFPKGAQHDQEILETSREWSFEHVCTPSLSDDKAAILEIRNIRRAEQQ